MLMASSEQTPRTVVPGEILADKYQVERVLGRGGMGVVVAARHIHLGTRVALKFLLSSVIGSQDLVTRFLREAQTASLIASEHVTRVLDVGTLADGSPFIVMEYLEGRDLASILREQGRLPIADAVDYTLQACEALAVAHAAGIVHRDLKPANMFLTEAADGSPHIKILDFGISKKQGLEGEFALTRTDAAIMGSPAYISPEQIRSQKKVDGRADIWSLGASLYELLSGQIPFMADSLGGLIAAILSDPPTPLRGARPEVPPGLEAAVHRCLEKSVAARPANVAILAQELRPFGSARGAASAERTTGVVARTTGGSLYLVQAMSAAAQAAEPVPAQPPPPALAAPPQGAGVTRPLGTPAPAHDRASAPSIPFHQPTPTFGTVAPSAAAPSAPSVTMGMPPVPGPAMPPPAAVSAPAPGAPPPMSVTMPGGSRASMPGAPPAAAITSGAWDQSTGVPAPPPGRPARLWVGVGAGLALTLLVGVLAVRALVAPAPAGTDAAAAPTTVPGPSAAAAPAAPTTAAESASSAPTSDPTAAEPAAAPSTEPSGVASAVPSARPTISTAPARTAAAKPRPSGAAGSSSSDLNKLIQNRK